MKKIQGFTLIVLFMLLQPSKIFSQHFGLEAGTGVCWPQYYNGHFGYFAPPYRHISYFQPEIYLEGIHQHNEEPLLLGIFDTDEISVSWTSWTDSTQADLHASTGYVNLITLHKVSMLNLHFGQSILIPWSFNDLLEFYMGYAITFPYTKETIYLPERSASFPYTAADFTDLERKKDGAGIECIAKARYELPFFYITTRFSYLFVPDLFSDHLWRRNLDVGIQYIFGKNK